MTEKKKELDLNDLIGEGKKANNDLILYDGVCNLCHYWKGVIQKHDHRKLHRFVPLQTITDESLIQYKIPTNLSAVILVSVVSQNTPIVYYRSDAVLRALRRLPFPWKLAYCGIIFPKFFRDRCYKFIGRNRYKWFGKRDKVE